MEIEIGKYYRTRDGRKARPITVNEYTGTIGSVVMGWYRDGRVSGYKESPDDLVAEWVDEPTIDDGGPAFAPNGSPHPTDPTKAYYGMSLRDYFASQALVGMLAGPDGPTTDTTLLCEDAYYFADIMLKTRSKKSE